MVGPRRVSRKHYIEMVEETSNHSLAKKYNSLLEEEYCRQVLISSKESGGQG